jgi:hypothetical protein
MILHIYELHAVLKNGYLLNLLLRIERCHDLHHLHHVVAAPNMSIEWQSSSPISAGEAKVPSQSGGNIPEACYTGQGGKIQSLCTDICGKIIEGLKI